MGRLITLTRRERETLLLLADGATTADIADELGIKLTSAHGYVKRVIDALDARNRTHAVALAYHRGVLLIPPRRAV